MKKIKIIKGSYWSEIEVAWLKALYPTKTKSELQRVFAPRTWRAIKCKAQRENIKVDSREFQKRIKNGIKNRR